MSVQAFYDELAPLYHLVYENWEASVARQGTALASLIGEHWGPSARTVLDAAVGIGTQALGLLARGFRVTGSDLSRAAVNRAQREAAARHLPLTCLVATSALSCGVPDEEGRGVRQYRRWQIYAGQIGPSHTRRSAWSRDTIAGQAASTLLRQAIDFHRGDAGRMLETFGERRG